MAAANPSPPDVQEVDRIAGLADPVIRNLQITHCYYRISAAFAARTGPCSNWCTFATWASRQAGQTIRAEDLLKDLQRRVGVPVTWHHPIQSLWRALLRRGMFRPETRLGRLVKAIHSPFDAFERASDAVARGNLKVFAEIGREFASYIHACPPGAGVESEEFQAFLGGLRPGDPPQGQDLLRQAFTNYQRQSLVTGGEALAQLVFLANCQIGLHEQTRLQPEIKAAMEAGTATAEDLSARALIALFPGSPQWSGVRRKPAARVMNRPACNFSRFASDLTRQVVTDHLMTLALPRSRVLALGRHLDAPFAEELRSPGNPDLVELLERFEPSPPAPDDCGARDWSDLRQRMHFIIHLFRSHHADATLLESPFTSEQARSFQAGAIPEGEL